VTKSYVSITLPLTVSIKPRQNPPPTMLLASSLFIYEGTSG